MTVREAFVSRTHAPGGRRQWASTVAVAIALIAHPLTAGIASTVALGIGTAMVYPALGASDAAVTPPPPACSPPAGSANTATTRKPVMNCLLCATDNHTTTAVAICHHRGAAVCQDHACYDNTPDAPPA